jgi:ParB/RepB/Spo0J family partition protein
MSSTATDPVEELGVEIESFADQALAHVREISEHGRDLLYYHVTGSSIADIATALGIKDPKQLPVTIHKMLSRFKFPATFTDHEVKLLIKDALAAFDAEESAKTKGAPATPVPAPVKPAPRPVTPAPRAVVTTPRAVPPSPVAEPERAPVQQPAPRPADPVLREPILLSIMTPVQPVVTTPLVVPSVESSPRLPVHVPAPPVVIEPVVLAPKSDSVPQVKGSLVTVSIHRLRRFEGQPRQEFDPQQLEWLAKSIKANSQLQPGLLRKIDGDPDIDFEIIDGERRWIASKMAGLSTYEGIEYADLSVEDAKRQYAISVISNFGRSQHTPLELAHASQKLMADNGWTTAEVAGALCMSEGTIKYHLRLLKLVPEVQALMRIDVAENTRLTIAHALKLVDYPSDFQRTVAEELLEKKLNGNRAPWYIRRRARELGVTVRQSRKGRRPASDARNLQRIFERFDANLEEYLNFGGQTVTEMFRRRVAKERTETIALIDKLVDRMEIMRENIHEAETPSK